MREMLFKMRQAAIDFVLAMLAMATILLLIAAMQMADESRELEVLLSQINSRTMK